MQLTKEQLKQLLPKNPYIDQWHGALAQLLPEYGIDTSQRIAAFVAQCAHESGNFVFLKENLNYRAPTLRKLFSKYFPTDALAEEYASKPNKQEAMQIVSMQVEWVMVMKPLVMVFVTVVVV